MLVLEHYQGDSADTVNKYQKETNHFKQVFKFYSIIILINLIRILIQIKYI